MEGCLEVKERKASLDASMPRCSIQGSEEDLPCREAFSSQTLVTDASSDLPHVPHVQHDLSSVLSRLHGSVSDEIKQSCQRAPAGQAGAQPQECEGGGSEKQPSRDRTLREVGTVAPAGSRPPALCPETVSNPGPQRGDHRLRSCESQRVAIPADATGCAMTVVSSYETPIARQGTACSVTDCGLPNGNLELQTTIECPAIVHIVNGVEPVAFETVNGPSRDCGLLDPAHVSHNANGCGLATVDQGSCGPREVCGPLQGAAALDASPSDSEHDAGDPARPRLPPASASMASGAVVRFGVGNAKSRATQVQSEVGGPPAPCLPSGSNQRRLARPHGNRPEGGAVGCLPCDRGGAGGDTAAEDVFAKMMKVSRDQTRPGAGKAGWPMGKAFQETDQAAHHQGAPPAKNAFSRMMEGQREQSRIHNFYLEHRGDGHWAWHWWDAQDPAAKHSLRGYTGEGPQPVHECRGAAPETAHGTREPDTLHAQDLSVPAGHGVELMAEASSLNASGKYVASSGSLRKEEGGTPGNVLQSQSAAGVPAKGGREPTLPYVWSAIVKAQPFFLYGVLRVS